MDIQMIKPTIADDRGYLTEFSTKNWEQVNILSSKAGTTRGNHFHKETIEKFYIVRGLLELTVSDVANDIASEYTIGTGQSFVINPLTIHTLHFLEDTMILSFYSKEFDPENTDIFTK